VTLLWAGLVVLGVAAVAVAVMLLVRRRAPAGSYFEDGDRAAGVFGVLATGFAVLLGFVVFLAFESYDTSRTGAEAEAQVVSQQFETAQSFPVAARGALSNDLVCYARTVVYGEWPQMQAGAAAALINPWSVEMFRTLQTVQPRTPAEQAAYSKWLDQRTDRQSARSDRTHGAEGVIPVPLWIVLFVSAAIIFLFMLLFADSAERAFVQATMMGGVAIVLSSMLLLLWFLDNPYHTGLGGLPPTAMKRAIVVLDKEAKLVGLKIDHRCNSQGTASSTVR
jgi:hypothetical protein